MHYSPVLPFEFCNDVQDYNARGRNYTYRTNWEIPKLVKLLTAALKTFMVIFARSFITTKRIHLKKNIVQVITHYLGEGDGRVKLGRGNSKLGVLLYQYASPF